jgi:ferredoxin
MNITFLSFVIALIMALGLVVTIAILSLLSGTMEFILGRPHLVFLKSKNKNGFSFGFKFNNNKEPSRLDTIQIRSFNPFGKPTQVEVTRDFSGQNKSFAQDIELGDSFEALLNSQGIQNSLVTVSISSSKEGVTYPFTFKGRKFLHKLKTTKMTIESFKEKNDITKASPLYATTTRSFIVDSLPKTNRVLKIASNPQFSGELAQVGAAEEKKENFSVSKVWIEPGCIVCDACESVYPEVFDVQEETCLIHDDYPKDNGLLVEEAADACPVEVIKFTKA